MLNIHKTNSVPRNEATCREGKQLSIDLYFNMQVFAS